MTVMLMPGWHILAEWYIIVQTPESFIWTALKDFLGVPGVRATTFFVKMNGDCGYDTITQILNCLKGEEAVKIEGLRLLKASILHCRDDVYKVETASGAHVEYPMMILREEAWDAMQDDYQIVASQIGLANTMLLHEDHHTVGPCG